MRGLTCFPTISAGIHAILVLFCGFVVNRGDGRLSNLQQEAHHLCEVEAS